MTRSNRSTTHRGTSGAVYTFVPTSPTGGSLYLQGPDPERPGAIEEVLVDDDVSREEIAYAVDRIDEEIRVVVATETREDALEDAAVAAEAAKAEARARYLSSAEVEVETCEHGLSAWLCEGPYHYPADRPY